MNKLVRLLSIFTLSASMAFWSCKGDQGPIGPTGAAGPQGTPGTNGKDGLNGTNGTNGNANVQSFQKTVAVADWAQVDRAGLGNGTTSKWGGVKLSNELIKGDSFVMVFFVSGENKNALPSTSVKDLDGSTEYLEYSYKTGQADVFYRARLVSGSTLYAPNSSITFDVVVTQKTIAASMENSGVNLKNYNEVMSYIKNNNIPVLK